MHYKRIKITVQTFEIIIIYVKFFVVVTMFINTIMYGYEFDFH